MGWNVSQADGGYSSGFSVHLNGANPKVYAPDFGPAMLPEWCRSLNTYRTNWLNIQDPVWACSKPVFCRHESTFGQWWTRDFQFRIQKSTMHKKKPLYRGLFLWHESIYYKGQKSRRLKIFTYRFFFQNARAALILLSQALVALVEPILQLGWDKPIDQNHLPFNAAVLHARHNAVGHLWLKFFTPCSLSANCKK